MMAAKKTKGTPVEDGAFPAPRSTALHAGREHALTQNMCRRGKTWHPKRAAIDGCVSKKERPPRGMKKLGPRKPANGPHCDAKKIRVAAALAGGMESSRGTNCDFGRGAVYLVGERPVDEKRVAWLIFSKFMKDGSGATAIQCGLSPALIAVAIIAATTTPDTNCQRHSQI
jgi:Flp pilus assembly pilin Flp